MNTAQALPSDNRPYSQVCKYIAAEPQQRYTALQYMMKGKLCTTSNIILQQGNVLSMLALLQNFTECEILPDQD